MNKLHCTAKATAMSKKHNPIGQPRLVKVADKAGDKLQFPADRHVATNPQREIPSPLAGLSLEQINEKRRLRAATVCQEQREARARREALAILEREDARRDAIAHGPAPTVREELIATRARPLDAPMAHQVGSLPDPFAQQIWAAVADAFAEPVRRSWWGQWKFTVALAVWSAACFVLGTLA